MKDNILKKVVAALVPLLLAACADQTAYQGNESAAADKLPESKLVADVVAVTGGLVRGRVRSEGLQEFLGIPYAAPPVGDLRWQPPAPLTAWEDEHDGAQFGLPCYQPGSLSAFYDRSYEEMSEDCLTLNVWTRAEKTSDALCS